MNANCERTRAIPVAIACLGLWLCAAAALPVRAGAAPARGEEQYALRKGDKVLFLGDSITAETKFFYKLYFDDIAKKYPALVEGSLPKYDGKGWGTPALTFVNGGLSGDTASGGLKRLRGLLAAHKPTACVVCFGMNDRYKNRANYVADLRAIVRQLKEAGVFVTVLTSPCVCALSKKDLQPFVQVLADMAKEAEQVAKDEGVLFADCYTPTRKILEVDKRDFTWGDGIHPNEEGHRVMANALQAVWGLGKPLANGAAAPNPAPSPAPAGGPRAEAPGAPAASSPAPAAGEWVNVTNNLGGERWGYAGVCTLAAVPGRTDIIAGVSEVGLWRSSDHGATWEALGTKGGDKIANRPYQLVFDPKDAQHFWLSGNYGSGIFETADGGQSFRRLGSLAHVDGLAVDFSDPERKTLLAGLHEQNRSLQLSTDGGKTWKKIGDALPEKSNFSTDPLVFDAKTFVTNTAGWKQGFAWGIYRTTDAGATWAKVADFGPCGPAVAAPDGAIYWGLCWGGGILKSTDQGQTWRKLPGPARACPVVMDEKGLAALTENRLYVSKDGGQTWEAAGPPIPGKPSGIIYQRTTRSVYAWQSSDKKSAAAVHRLTLSSP